jgi:hypothetical protein
MNNSTRTVRRRCLAWPTATRTAVAVIAALPLIAAACGGSGTPAAQVASQSSSSNAAAPSPQANGAVAFARCMRSHRVPNWPDPSNSGVFDKSKLTPQQLGASSSRIQAAQTACQHLLANGGGGQNPAQVEQMRALSLKFAECVRRHGVPNLPDPGSDGRIPDPASVGINQGSPKFEAANQSCRKYRPPYMPSNAQYRAYAQTHG